MKEKIKTQNGITLIALIVTIIIMLILAAVTINMAINGGLFSKAQKAVDEMENAIGYEENLINEMYNMIEENEPNTSVELTEYEKAEKDANGCVIANTPYESDGLTAMIPAGFKVSEKTGETSIANGLVIQDAEGNEFVWVPCTTDANDGSGLTLYAQDKQYNDGITAEKQYDYNDYSDWHDEGGNANSVEKYGGFYVARYEAGIPTNAPFYPSDSSKTYIYDSRNTTGYIPVSKANNPSWNGISQENAIEVSKAMYGSSTSVTSSLIDSYAWDTIVNWMEKRNSGIATNSTNYGNYVNSTMSLTDALYATYTMEYGLTWNWKGRPSTYNRGNLKIDERSQSGEQTIYEIATGATEKTKVLNIYDMAGNMWEWTTEVGYHDEEDSATQFAVIRGGSFDHTGNSYPLSSRNGSYTPAGTDYHVGFRVVLYIK